MGVVTFALHYEMGTLALACFDRNVYKPIVSSFQFTHPSSTLSKAPRHWLCEGNSPVTGESPLTETGEFLSQKASNAENVSIWRRHHDRKQPLPSHTKHNKARFVCVILEMCYIHGALSQKLRGVFIIDFPTHTHTHIDKMGCQISMTAASQVRLQPCTKSCSFSWDGFCVNRVCTI